MMGKKSKKSKKKGKKKLTKAQLHALLLLEKEIQTKINFTCGVGLSQQDFAAYKGQGCFRITAKGITYLRNRRNSEQALRPRREGSGGVRHNTWVSITPQEIVTSRKALIMSQQELAKLVGVSRQTISNWEVNAWGASLEHQNRLRDIFSALNAHWESCDG